MASEDPGWQHKSILLKPLSEDPGFEDIVLSDDALKEFKIIGIFVCVLGE